MKDNHMIKQGQIIGMGKTKVDLLVRVEEVKESVFSGHVINGAWDLHYDTHSKLLTVHSPFGNSEVKSNILFVDPIPIAANYQTYNEAISYMNAHLNRWRVVSLALQVTYHVNWQVTHLYKRLKTSTQMFIRTWKQGSTDVRCVNWDDDIPF